MGQSTKINVKTQIKFRNKKTTFSGRVTHIRERDPHKTTHSNSKPYIRSVS